MYDEALLIKLRQAFKMEAAERLASMTATLLELEKGADGTQAESLLEIVYREAHSLKGASGAIDLGDVETLCQSMESVFSAMKKQELTPSPAMFDTLHEAVAAIESIVESEGDEFSHSESDRIVSLVSLLESIKEDAGCRGGDRMAAESCRKQRSEEEAVAPEPAGEPVPVEEPAEPPIPPPSTKSQSSSPTSTKSQSSSPPSASDSVRIATNKLDTLLLKVEELVSLKLMSQQNLDDLRDILRLWEAWSEKRAKIEKQVSLLRDQKAGAALKAVIVHLDWSREHLLDLGGELKKAIRSGSENQYGLGRMVDDILDDVKKVTMLPFSTLLGLFPKMIRDLARNQGKEIDLKISGGDIEIDKRILEEMKDPFIHLLRNSADHGLENSAAREAAGKSRNGTIEVTVTQTEGDKVEISLSDDGKGIDPVRVRAEAVDRGIISREDAEKLDDSAAVGLIFRSGVSTSPMVTQISGRGLGMAIVQERIEKLGGSLSIDSRPGKGTAFNIELPVTVATFRGILVRSGDRRFILPSVHVDRVVRVARDGIRTVEGKDTILLDGQALPLVELSQVLECQSAARGGSPPAEGSESAPPDFTAIVLGSGGGRIAFLIDAVLNEQEVLVKSLGKQLVRVRNIAGVTILGSGKPVLILNVNDLLKSASRTAARRSAPAAAEGEAARKSILVAEDSITSRTLLKNILESAGYAVTTAVDGFEAYTAFQSGSFDLVVSDVEMPRMNGFELTSRIRASAADAETPVVLVTALKSSEDRERGLDAGASAYIVKSTFDQSNLLDTLKRLT